MKLTTKCEYALLAMLTLTKAYKKDTIIPVKTIARKNDIPKEFLEKIVSTLSKAGLVSSKKGASGGITLAKNPRRISIADIIHEIDGALAPVKSVSKYSYEHSPIEKSKSLTVLFKRIRDIQDKILSNTKLSDLIK